MSLIQCHECKTEISDQASSCPKCGFPIEKAMPVLPVKYSWTPQVILIIMLLGALNPNNPYAYYVLLRWVCCAILIFLVVQAISKEKTLGAWILGLFAALYNPIIPLHLDREIWSTINIVTIVMLLGSIFYLRTGNKS